MKTIIPKMPDNQIYSLLEIINLNNGTNLKNTISELSMYINRINGNQKRKKLIHVIENIKEQKDIIILAFNLKICLIKDLLLQEKRVKKIFHKSVTNTKMTNGVLQSLLLLSEADDKDINLMTKDAIDFIKVLSKEAMELKNSGYEIESLQL